MSVFYPEGVYQCQVVEYGFAEAQTGTPQFLMKFKVLANAEGEEEARQYERTFYRPLTEKTIPYFAEDVKNLGWSDVTKPMMQLDPNESQYVDHRGQMVLMYAKEVADNKGGSKESWSVARSGGGQALATTKLDGAKKRSLDNLFAAELRNQGGTPKPAVKRAAAPLPQAPPPSDFDGITDEDVPY